MPSVKIERIELRLVRMELISPFRTSFGVEQARHCLIVSAHAEGLTGWGECVAAQGSEGRNDTNWNFYSYETTETAWHILKDFLAPALVGRKIASVEEVVAIGQRLRGHPMARAGLEAAVWDLRAQAHGVSLADLLAGNAKQPEPRRDKVSVGVSIGIQPTTEAFIEAVKGFASQGYRRVKLKIEPGKDLDTVRAVRDEFPDLLLMVDANSAYSLSDADHLRELDEFDLMMIEQPLGYDDIYEHSRLQPLLETPICLDESIHSVDHAKWAYEIGACRIINIKPGRVGGLWVSREIHDLSLAQGKPVWCGGMLETGIGRAANIALASLPGFELPSDISASDRYYLEDLIDPPFVLNHDSTLTVPTAVGLGVRVREGLLETVTQRQVTITDKRQL